MSSDNGKIVIRCVFILIGFNFLLWNFVMPVLEPPDESGHYTHARIFALTWRIPDLRERPQPQGFSQYPPAYYALLSPIVYLFGAPDYYVYDQISYHPLKSEFKKTIFSIFQHSLDEIFSWNDLQRTVHVMRFVSSLLGLGTIIFVYKTASLIFGRQKIAPVLAAVFVGFNPMFAQISASVTNVNLLVFLFSLFFYLTVKWLNDKSANPSYFLLGLISGLAIITKVTGLQLIGLTGIFWLIKNFRSGQSLSVKKTVKQVLLFTSGLLIFSGWYFGLNLHRYGSLVPLREMLFMVNRETDVNVRMQDMGELNYWFRFPITSLKTIFSGYGSSLVHLPRPILWSIFAILVISVWGIELWMLESIHSIKQKKSPSANDKLLMYLFVGWMVILASHVRVNISMEAFHGKDLFPGIVPMVVFGLIGIKWFVNYVSFGLLARHKLFAALILIFTGLMTYIFTQQVAIVRQIKGEDNTLIQLSLSFVTITFGYWLLWKALGLSIVKDLAGYFLNKFTQNSPGLIIVIAVTGFAINISILKFLIIPLFYL